MAAGFFGSLSAFSAFSKIYNIGDFQRVPLRTRVVVLTTAPVAEAVSELAAKSVSSASFASAQLGDAKGRRVSRDLSNELAKTAAPSSISLLGNELRRACGIAVDAKFLALMAATSGITSAATTGVTAAKVLADLTARLTALTIGADSRLWFDRTARSCTRRCRLVQGTGGFLVQDGKIGPISVAPSDALTTTAFLIDAQRHCGRARYSEAGQLRQGIVATRQRPDQWQLSTGSPCFKTTALRCDVRSSSVRLH